jgi:hypothetical protein
MTSKEQRKAKKKKAKEREAKKRVLARREQLRAPAREEREERRREKRQDKLMNDVSALENNFQFYTEEQLAACDEETLTQLEKNCKILRGLELEFEKEVEAKLKLNADLEEEGHTTLKDKLNAMSQKTIDQQKKAAQVGMGGSADCKMGPAKAIRRNPKDTAEVALVKAVEEVREENS